MRELTEENRAPISVLFYHRVADTHPNDWTISKDQFVRHIEYCREHFEIISLGEAQTRLQQKRSPRPAIAITFDDGYAENMRFAIPWLICNRIPCTYFVATEHVRNGRPFAHDVENRCPLDVNTIEQLRAASHCGIEIGLHTANHADFNRITTRSELETEIVDAKMDLEIMIGERVNYFAVPYGLPEQMRPAVMQTARDCGLRGICSAYGGYNMVGDDPFHIRRIHGDPDFIRLRNWLSFDERKLRQTPTLPTEDVIAERDLRSPFSASPANSRTPIVTTSNLLENGSLLGGSSLLPDTPLQA
ncbi:polysaccharide deacetylase family protein [Rhodopirellula sp. SWK7]|uniref:polysaccharide deacetylase family protein n=1 Tax=Rhodopirellula sp. SWK7 TaxID=595460 RepID=UPI0002BEFFCE|nr:polysaccharide deacetylase family protein [Rhodopirellula sp. SWK7]EMI46260.1 polysaccharide deacetylase [Rhodopirellula sp. SWK7]